MSQTPVLPPKKEVANTLLQGPSVYVHLDPRRDGVTVPNWFRNQPQLVLQMGLHMALPIHDLDVTDDGISGTLSFNRRPFWCMMPWSAVFGLVGEDGRGMIWPDDVPAELAAQHNHPNLRVVSDKKPRKKLRAVEDYVGEDPKDGDPPAEIPRAEGARPPSSPKLEVLATAPQAEQPAPKLALVDEAPAEKDGAAKKNSKLPPYLRVIK